MEARGLIARVSRVEFSTSLWVLRCSTITLVPPVVTYRRIQYRQRHSGLPVFWLKCWIWGAGSGIRFHTQVVRGRFEGKMQHGARENQSRELYRGGAMQTRENLL
jgi:hypothetical protein